MRIIITREDGETVGNSEVTTFNEALETAWIFSRYHGAGLYKVYDRDSTEPIGYVSTGLVESEDQFPKVES